MLIISEQKRQELRRTRYEVYAEGSLKEGAELSPFQDAERPNKHIVNSFNIRHVDGKFYFTEEDLSDIIDWFPAHIIPIGRSKLKKTKRFVARKNEEIEVHEYRFYNTLFNKFTLKQIQFERRNLHDGKFISSKYDLVSRMQGSKVLKSKDFKMINVARKDNELVPIGMVVKESKDKNSLVEYGIVYINMDNRLSILWA